MITTILHVKRRQKLIEACYQALENPKFKKTKRKTFCNLAARYIAEALGAVSAATKVFLMWTRTWSKYITGTANVITKNAEKLELKRIINKEQAQEWAWRGFIILLCWYNPKGSGHVAIVYPTDPEKEPMKICNIGAYNLICEPEDPKAFGKLKYTMYRLPIIF
jgi:hypothetical protein